MDNGSVPNEEFYATQALAYRLAKAAGATEEVLDALRAMGPNDPKPYDRLRAEGPPKPCVPDAQFREALAPDRQEAYDMHIEENNRFRAANPGSALGFAVSKKELLESLIPGLDAIFRAPRSE